jgi:cell wall-associated NlpC family hydrolase
MVAVRIISRGLAPVVLAVVLAAVAVPSIAQAIGGGAERRATALHRLHSLQRRLDLTVQRFDRARADRAAADRMAEAASMRSVGDDRFAMRAAALEAAQSASWIAVGRAMGLRLRIHDLIARERRVLASLPQPERLRFLAGSSSAVANARTVLRRLTASGALRGHAPGVRAARLALGAVGVPYVWGGESVSGFDCSGLVQWAYGRVGVSLPRVAADQMQAGRPVRASALQPGDLVFFEPGIGHVAMYLGDGLIVEAPHPGAVVWVTELGDSWHSAEYQGAVRP